MSFWPLLTVTCLSLLQFAVAQSAEREGVVTSAGRDGDPPPEEKLEASVKSVSSGRASRQRHSGDRAEWLSFSKWWSPGGDRRASPAKDEEETSAGPEDAFGEGGPRPEEVPPLWGRILKAPYEFVTSRREEPPRADYFSVSAQDAAFHLTNFEVPWDTKEFAIEEGMVGRSLGEGEKWAWVELHTGAVGLMRKKHLSGASRVQIDRFLTLEAENRKPVPAGPVVRDPYEGLTVPMNRGRSHLPFRRVTEAGEVAPSPRMEEPKSEPPSAPTPPVPLETAPPD